MNIQRWPSASPGRSRIVSDGSRIYTVANATDAKAGFGDQVRQSLAMLESHLHAAGSARTHILSIQVLLADIADRGAFDALWTEWIGPQPSHWPQRACYQAGLAPGLLVELIAVAAPSDAPLGVAQP